jgi:adenylate cyclase
MQDRRLAAIMFTDIVGYTALMGSEEDHAFEVLRKNREIHKKSISEHNETIIKEMGDGILAQFNSAVEAVNCGIVIQKLAKNTLSKIRIGIHLGDITFENEDVFGDGVNIASPIQSIADPGGIYITETVQKSIRSKSDIPTKFLGEFVLKNVGYKVKTYSVSGDGLPVPGASKIKQLKGQSRRMRLLKSLPIYGLLILIMLGV